MIFQKLMDGHGSLNTCKCDPGSAAIAVGGSLISGAIGKSSSDKATKAATKGADAQIAEERRQFNLTREDLAPYRKVGTEALNWLRQLSRGNAQDFYANSPGYKLRVREGEKALNRRLSAMGMYKSGPAYKAAIDYGQGVAADEFGNYWNRLSGLAGIGQTATTAGANLGAGSASRIGNAMAGAGSARASSYLAGGDAMNRAIQGGISNYMLSNYLNPSPATPSTIPNYYSDPSGFVYNL